MRYEKLEVYKKSYDLALSLYRFSDFLPEDEKYGLISQLRRSTVSIPLNIAEGYGKQSTGTEFKRYLSMAKGSCNEVMVLLDFLRDLGLLKEEHHRKYHEKYKEIEKMLFGLIRSIGN